MQIKASTPQEYIEKLPKERQAAFKKLRKVILDHLPEGFAEAMSYGMVSFVVPHSLYPAGYHCNPKESLPFISIASQKHFIAVYHMGIYSSKALMKWFTGEYSKKCSGKLDMGKSCIRFKKIDQIPYKLIGELASKMSMDEWVEMYEKAIKK